MVRPGSLQLSWGPSCVWLAFSVMTKSSCHHGWFDQKQNGTCRHMKHLYCTLFLTFRAHHAQNLHFRTAGKNVVPSQRAMIKYRWWRYHSQHHPTNKMPAVKETSVVALPWRKMLRIATKWLRNISRLFGMICKVLQVELVFCIAKPTNFIKFLHPTPSHSALWLTIIFPIYLIAMVFLLSDTLRDHAVGYIMLHPMQSILSCWFETAFMGNLRASPRRHGRHRCHGSWLLRGVTPTTYGHLGMHPS